MLKNIACLFVRALLVLHVVAAAIAAFSSLSIVGRAGERELQAEIGQCRYGNVGDGTFQQTDLHTDNYMRPLCVGVALADHWSGSERLGWIVRVTGTGSIRARDNASTQDEHAHAHHGCNRPSGDDCLVRFNGEGQTFGVSFGATVDFPLRSHLKLVGEGGLFFFQHHFKAEAFDMECRGCSGRQIAYNETSRLWDMPSPLLGLSLRYRNFYVAARHYWPTGHRSLSLTEFSMTQYVVGVAIPLGD